MDLSQALDNLKFDVRMREWNLKQSKVTKEEIEAYQKGLRDQAQEVEQVTLEDKGGDF